MKYIKMYEELHQSNLSREQLFSIMFAISPTITKYLKEFGDHSYYGERFIDDIYKKVDKELKDSNLESIPDEEKEFVRKTISDKFQERNATSYYNDDIYIIDYYTELYKDFDIFKKYYYFVNMDLLKDKKDKVSKKINDNIKKNVNIDEYITKILDENKSKNLKNVIYRYKDLVDKNFLKTYKIESVIA